jgi:hypothetical protein
MAPSGMGVAAAIRQARLRGATPHVLDGAAVRDSAAMLDSVAGTLRFPDDFGHNLTALYDCLTDLSWLPAGEHVLIWGKPSVLRRSDPTGFEAINGALSEAVTDGSEGGARLSVVILSN